MDVAGCGRGYYIFIQPWIVTVAANPTASVRTLSKPRTERDGEEANLGIYSSRLLQYV